MLHMIYLDNATYDLFNRYYEITLAKMVKMNRSVDIKQIFHVFWFNIRNYSSEVSNIQRH